MAKLVSLAMVAHAALLLEGLVPQARVFLPLGGTELSQFGALFGGVIVLDGIWSLFR